MQPDRAVPEAQRRTTCRVCGGTRLEQVLSLGTSPLANSFLRSPAEFVDEPRYPLELYFCETCSVLQLLHVVDPEVLFRHYIYVTGTSDTMARHNRAYAQRLREMLDLGPGDLVVEAASNDGSLLACFQALGVRTLGVEPATNIAAAANAAGIETLNTFFGQEVGRTIRGQRGSARAVVANNVLAHVDAPSDFLAGCRELVDSDGIVAIEVPYVRDLLDRVEYDTVYHEHLCYFSITALLRLCDGVGLSIARVDHEPVHGGSLRLYLRPAPHRHAADVLEMADHERAIGLTGIERYRRFATEVRNHRDALVRLLEDLAGQGRTIVGYGAPAKANTLLNYCGIDARLLPYTVDKSPLKVGTYMPGTHIPVRAVDEVAATAENGADYMLILAWNFADEIMEQQQAFKARGGRFIVPIPEPRVV